MIKTLQARGSYLAKATEQVQFLESGNSQIEKFDAKLKALGLYPLQAVTLDILQVNVGYMCNQTCTHCHVDAGPDRKEIMTRQTMAACLEAVKALEIKTVDITGGAPEMNPDFVWFVEELAKLQVEIIVRSNLTILVANKKYDSYPTFFKEHRVQVIASLPCYTMANTDKQRGNGVFSASIEAIKRLNAIGYGKDGTGLQLNLVYNPGGAAIAPDQQKLEQDYKQQLWEHFGLEFNKLFTITNLPISRFLDYLLLSEKYEEYMHKLANAFNPAAARHVMCRNTLSVGWDGRLYDCDFNQMLQLPLKMHLPQHIQDYNAELLRNRDIVLGQHCYGCTAGAGSSCQGALV
ncbi:radical SAM/Cys-rich domain protein [Pontibacter qinzhouensis]|uniref:Radical SAM/Cys-rich domain protein n=1 Tax=Pontibacter qinzhouensis TaxID=2603253 RepID=A0A5C8KAU1_9BACT|nr:arsenosugar biosynthesis radical SAM (seleno)protein ArsS [Pontibacter qinzhouensis]TXK49100.1 radical SAM/Cys-rich domain protein [Pontibacter qinzhouensis]